MCCQASGEGNIAISSDPRQTLNSRGNFYGRVINQNERQLCITRILYTNDEEVEIQEPLVKLDEIEPVWNLTGAPEKKKR
jgi:hypothetical protein